MRSEHGAATVEHAAISLLIVALVAAVLAALASGTGAGGRELGSTLGRKLRCAAVGPGPCWRDPLTLAYGRSVAGAVRGLAPPPTARRDANGTPLWPVDFRLCRSVGCAQAGSRPGFTAQDRRITEFVSVSERRPGGDLIEISYWSYRPALGWHWVARLASKGEVARLAPTPLSDDQIPALVPLETLGGRNQYDWAPGEEPPWRWRIRSVYPGMPTG